MQRRPATAVFVISSSFEGGGKTKRLWNMSLGATKRISNHIYGQTLGFWAILESHRVSPCAILI